MKRWVISVLFLIVASFPAVSVADDGTFDFGKSTRFSLPPLVIPFGAPSDPDAAKKKEEGGIIMGEKDKEAKPKKPEKSTMDKKVDDAIDKAWGRETTESPDPPK